MQTFSGRKFWPMDPRPEEIRLADIAHALANICRFNGHTKTFYSVAQHSVLAADYAIDQFLNTELARYCLLHDSAEAYLGDVIRPIKHSLLQRDFIDVEENLLGMIYKKFSLDVPDEEMGKTIKTIDDTMLVTEHRDVIGYSKHASWEWGGHLKLWKHRIVPESAGHAEFHFLKAFGSLFGAEIFNAELGR